MNRATGLLIGALLFALVAFCGYVILRPQPFGVFAQTAAHAARWVSFKPS